MSASRIVRSSVILSAYNYKIEYKKGNELYEADMLSRLPLPIQTEVESGINSFNLTEELPVTYEDIAKATAKDQILIKVMDFVKTGWPKSVQPEFKAYFIKRNEMSVENKCLMVGIRVVIPKTIQSQVLDVIHKDHIGIVRAKMLARTIMWWPSLQTDLEVMINSCRICNLNKNNSEKFLVSWPKTENVFDRMHIDFFYLRGVSFLLIVDSNSKWIDIHCMNKGTDVTQVIEKLKVTFAYIGLPNIIVSDNGPPFNSNSFTQFCHVNGINVLKSPPYHPQSNGLAERHVQTVKQAIKKMLMQNSTLTIEQQIVNFLFSYRNTPSSTTGLSPNEYIFKIKPRTLLDLIKPKEGKKILVSKRDDYVRPPIFSVNEKVLVGKLGPYTDVQWKEGSIVKCMSAVTYLVNVDGTLMYKHVNSLQKLLMQTNDNNVRHKIILKEPVTLPQADKLDTTKVDFKEHNKDKDNKVSTEATKTEETVEPRRSSRVRKAPERLDL